MIQAVTSIAGVLATYWAAVTAGERAGRPLLSLSDVSRAMLVSAILSAMVFLIGAIWSFLADSMSFPAADAEYHVLHAWLVLVGPVVALVIVPACYAASALHVGGFRLNDRWRIYGFPSAVTAIYAGLNVMSLMSDRVEAWLQVGIWSYALLPIHGLAVFASWFVYVDGMDRWVARN